MSFLHNYLPILVPDDNAVADNPPVCSQASLNATLRQWAPDPRHPGQAPYDQARRALPPSITAVAVDNPPVRLIAGVLALLATTWAAPAFAAQQTRPSVVPSLTVQAAADLPARPSQTAVLQSWRIDWSVPQRPRQIAAFTASLDEPPFGARHDLRAEAPAWWPAQSARKLTPPSVDDPPFDARAEQRGEASAWWPAQSSRKLTPPSVDDPPFHSRPEQQLMPSAPVWWPSQSAGRIASFTASVDEPPRLSRNALDAVRGWWQQAPLPLPQRAAALAQDGTPGFVPFVRAPFWSALSYSPSWPVAQRLLPPAITAVPEDNPPFALARPASWTPPQGWTAQAKVKIAPLMAATAADDPPFGLRRAVWFEAPAWPVPAKLKIAAFTASIDDPPFGKRVAPLFLARASWPAQSALKLTPPSVDNPPPRASRAAASFAAPAWSAQSAAKVAPVLAAGADNPPFGLRRAVWFDAPAWTVQAKAKIAAFTASLDDPPFGLRTRTLFVAAPSWAAQTAPRLVPPSIDAPPPVLRRPHWTAPAAWPAQAAAKVAPLVSQADDPPFGRKPFVWRAEAGASLWRHASKIAPLAGVTFVVGDLSDVVRVALAPSLRVASAVAPSRTALHDPALPDSTDEPNRTAVMPPRREAN